MSRRSFLPWVLLGLLALGAPDRATTAGNLEAGLEDLDGWSLEGTVQTFDAGNLWRHIDGADQHFLSYGCRRLELAYLRGTGGRGEVTVEVYTMADPVGAFGLYAAERPAAGRFLELGAQGFASSGEVAFHGGRRYVKLKVHPAGEKEQALLRTLAELLAERLAPEERLPESLDRFPREDRVPGSEAGAPAGLLGLSGLSPSLRVEYRKDGRSALVHLMEAPAPSTSEQAWEKLRIGLERQASKGLEGIQVPECRGWRAEVPYHGTVVLLGDRSHLVLAKGEADAAWLQSLAIRLLEATGKP